MQRQVGAGHEHLQHSWEWLDRPQKHCHHHYTMAYSYSIALKLIVILFLSPSKSLFHSPAFGYLSFTVYTQFWKHMMWNSSYELHPRKSPVTIIMPENLFKWQFKSKKTRPEYYQVKTAQTLPIIPSFYNCINYTAKIINFKVSTYNKHTCLIILCHYHHYNNQGKSMVYTMDSN